MLIITENIWILALAVLLLFVTYCSMLLVERVSNTVNRNKIEVLQFKQFEFDIELARKKKNIEDQKSLSWTGNRKFEVLKKAFESPDKGICSFYLTPHDKKAIPDFKPGQFLTFEIPVPGQAKSVIRCYSLSDAPQEDFVYRVSIKRVPAPRGSVDIPAGLSSNYFHDHIEEGDILDVRAPGGNFFMDTTSNRPVVLIGGGVGLTPVLSMLNTIIKSGSARETWFFYGLRNGQEHCQKEYLKQVAAEHENLHIIICYSNPDPSDQQGRDYDFKERVSVELFKRQLPSSNYQFLMCGPPPMMDSIISDLQTWNVPEGDILRESFGPASGKKKPPKVIATDSAGPETMFKRSTKQANWDPQYGNLVEFAEASEVAIPNSCMTGNCGSCLTTIIEGEVEYIQETSFDIETGSCLACSCIPKGKLILDV